MNDAAPWIDPELIAAGQFCRARPGRCPTARRRRSPRCAPRSTGSARFSAKVRCRSRTSATCHCPARTARCRAASICRTGRQRPPLMVYAHGGGFMQGSIPSWDALLRELVRQSGVAALSVDYKLSPEHRFPVAFDEMVAMIRLVAREGAGSASIPPGSRSVATRRGQLALATALACAKPASGRSVSAAGLWRLLDRYREPVLAAFRPRRRTIADPDAVDLGDLLEQPDQQKDWRPRRSRHLAGLPPAHLIVGSLDPLLDDSHKLAAKLKAAGVKCELTVYPGINHGFIRYGRLIGTARRAIADCAAALKAGF